MGDETASRRIEFRELAAFLERELSAPASRTADELDELRLRLSGSIMNLSYDPPRAAVHARCFSAREVDARALERRALLDHPVPPRDAQLRVRLLARCDAPRRTHTPSTELATRGARGDVEQALDASRARASTSSRPRSTSACTPRAAVVRQVHIEPEEPQPQLVELVGRPGSRCRELPLQKRRQLAKLDAVERQFVAHQA